MQPSNESYLLDRHEPDGIGAPSDSPTAEEILEIRAMCEKLGPQHFARPHHNNITPNRVKPVR